MSLLTRKTVRRAPKSTAVTHRYIRIRRTERITTAPNADFQHPAKPFDPAEYLDDSESIAAYMTEALESGDPAFVADALGVIARARGMTEIAKSAGITREALYKALRPDSAPRFDTVSRVCAALGVRLVAQAIHPATDKIAA